MNPPKKHIFKENVPWKSIILESRKRQIYPQGHVVYEDGPWGYWSSPSVKLEHWLRAPWSTCYEILPLSASCPKSRGKFQPEDQWNRIAHSTTVRISTSLAVAMTTTSTCPQGGSRVGSALLILHPMPGFQKILRSQEQVVELLPSLCGQDTKGQERLGKSRPMLVTS